MGALSLSTSLRMGMIEADEAGGAGGEPALAGTDGSVREMLEREFIEPKMNGLTRSQLVERIMSHNGSATAEFLESFDVESLWSYLDHLMDTTRPRSASAARVRPAGRKGVSLWVRSC